MATRKLNKSVFCMMCLCFWTIVSLGAEKDILKDCKHQKMDVVFLQDASFSVGNHSFATAKLFIADIVRELPIGLDLVRVALVRFGTDADVIASLSQSTDVATVTQAIEGMTYKIGGTQTGKGLKTVRGEVLNERRPEARAVVVVITDGNSMKFRETRREARQLRKEHVRLVWLYINANDTDSIAFGRERDYMTGEGDTTLGAVSFEALDEEARMQILNASCKEDPITTTTTPAAPPTTSTASTPNDTSPTDVDVTPPATSLSDDEDISSTYDSTKKVTTPAPTPVTTPTIEPRSTKAKETTTIEQDSYAKAEPSTAKTEPSTAKTEPSTAQTESLPSKTESSMAQTEASMSESEPSSASLTTRTPESTPGSKDKDLATFTYQTKQTNTNTGNASSAYVTTQEPSLSSSKAKEKEEKTEQGSGSAEGEEESKKDASVGDSQEGGEEGAWEDSLGNILGLTVGVFALAALTSGLVYFALWRRRRRERKVTQDP